MKQPNDFEMALELSNQYEKQASERQAITDVFHDKIIALKTIAIHPIAKKLPMIPADKWKAFKASIIETGGFTSYVVIDTKGRIVDGRNRVKVAQEILREKGQTYLPAVRIAWNDEDIALLSAGANIHRRHLTKEELLKAMGQQTAKAKDERSDKVKKQAASRANKDDTSSNEEVSSEPKVALNKLVCDAIDCGNAKATRQIKRALDGLGKESVKGHRYTQTEATEILGWLGDNPAKPRAKTKTASKPKAEIIPPPDDPESVEVTVKHDTTYTRAVIALHEYLDGMTRELLRETIDYANKKLGESK